MPLPLFPDEVKPGNITFGEAKNYGTMGGCIRYIYHDRNILHLELPWMYCPFGASTYGVKDGERWSIALSFNDLDNPDIKAFYNFLGSFDRYLRDCGKNNQKSWFKKGTTKADIDNKYSALLRNSGQTDSEKKGYPDLVRVKLFQDTDGNFESQFWDCDGELVAANPDNIKKIISAGSKIKCIVRVMPVWFMHHSWGVSLRMEQVIVDSQKSFHEYAFRVPPPMLGQKKSQIDDFEDEQNPTRA